MDNQPDQSVLIIGAGPGGNALLDIFFKEEGIKVLGVVDSIVKAMGITTAPGNIVFTYTALGIAQVASTTFGITCTNLLPYTMALDATSGVVSGLKYSLTVAASSIGIGLLQTHPINGTMPAGQAGTCTTATCAGSQLHTLTIAY